MCDSNCNSYTDSQGCDPNLENFEFPGSGDFVPATTKEEPFATYDVSWPCLKGIYVENPKDLHFIQPGSFIDDDNKTYKVSKLGFTDPSQITLTKEIDTLQPMYLGLKHDAIQNHTYRVYQTKLLYQAQFPDSSKVNPSVNPCADSTFETSSNDLFQFYYSASIPFEYYQSVLSPPVLYDAVDGKGPCFLQKGVKCSQTHGANVIPNNTAKGAFSMNQDTIFNRKTCVAPQASGAVLPSKQKYCLTDCDSSSQLNQSTVSAFMRDGFGRLSQADAASSDFAGKCKNQSCGSCKATGDGWGGMWYAGYRSEDDPQGGVVPNQMDFSKASNPNQMCAQSPQDTDALVYFDMNSDNQIEKKFLQIVINGGFSNIFWGQTQQDSKGNLILQSFNIMNRKPTCNTLKPPTSSTAGYDSNYKTQNCSSATQPSWTFDTHEDVDLTKWPALISDFSKDHVPDIVVRIVFQNPLIWDSVGGWIKPLADDTVRNFPSHVQSLWQQNTVTAPATLADCLVAKFERGVLFLEFLSTIVYSVLYNFNTHDGLTISDFYTPDRNLIPPSGQYSMQQYLKFLFDGWKLDYSTNPGPISMVSKDESRSIQNELDAYVYEMIQHTDTYLKLPQFSMNSSNRLIVQFTVHPMMHVALTQSKDPSQNSEIYLNNLFQDYSWKSDLIPKDAYSSGTTGVITVNTKDSQWGLNTGIPIQLQNMVYSSDIKFTNPDMDQTYIMGYTWEGEVTRVSVGAMLYIMEHQMVGFSDLQSFQSSNILLPTPISGPEPCLVTKPLTGDCKNKICNSSSDCLCDYSVMISALKNPQTDLYYNNSNGICACLASDSHPKASQGGGRALNPVSMCFAKSCKGVQDLDEGFCENTACSVLQQDLELLNTPSSEWYKIFPDQAQDSDVAKLNQTCGTNFPKPRSPAQPGSTLNLYNLIGSIALGLTVPLALFVDFVFMKRRRTKLQYLLVAGIALLMIGLSVFLYFLLTGTYECESISQQNTDQAPCKDGIFKKMKLTPEACQGQNPTFCQCTNSCSGYLNSDKATCVNPQLCAFCTKDTSIVDTEKVTQTRTQIPTPWWILGIGVGLCISTILCVVVPIPKPFLVGIPLLVLGLGFGAAIVAINRMKETKLVVNIGTQQEQSTQKDPCVIPPSFTKSTKKGKTQKRKKRKI